MPRNPSAPITAVIWLDICLPGEGGGSCREIFSNFVNKPEFKQALCPSGECGFLKCPVPPPVLFLNHLFPRDQWFFLSSHLPTSLKASLVLSIFFPPSRSVLVQLQRDKGEGTGNNFAFLPQYLLFTSPMPPIYGKFFRVQSFLMDLVMGIKVSSHCLHTPPSNSTNTSIILTQLF